MGRDEFLDSLATRGGEGRLVTLVGPAGVGKTRVALAHAEGAGLGRVRGVFFCECAGCGDLDDLVSQVLEVLGLGASPEADTASEVVRIGHALDARETELLVLDNVEQIVDPIAQTVPLWLEQASSLSVLLTSRVLLRLRGELPAEVPGLDTASATRLFVVRAEALSPGFDVAGAEEDVRTIVSRLDGIPLAIELSAARTQVLRVDQIRDRLDRPLKLLRGGFRGDPERQDSVEGALRGSWALLDEEARRTFMWCAMLAGTFSADDAEGLMGADVSASLGALRDASLLSGDPREGLRWLLPVRAFGLMKLGESGHLQEARAAHARWALGVRPHRLRDLRDAFEWAVEQESGVDLALDLHTALFDAGGRMDRPEVRLARVDALLAIGERLTAVRRRRLLRHRVRALADAKRLDEAEVGASDMLAAETEAFEHGTGPDGEVSRRGDLADAWAAVGFVAFYRGDLGKVETAYRKAEMHGRGAVSAQLGSRIAAGLGVVEHLGGNPEGARTHYEVALAHAREAQDGCLAAEVLGRLGLLSWESRSLQDARRRYEEAMEGYRAVGNDLKVAETLGDLGNVARGELDYATARSHFRRAVQMMRSGGDVFWLAVVHMDWGILELYAHDPDAARTLLRAAQVPDGPDIRVLGLASAYECALEASLGDRASASACRERALSVLQPALMESWGLSVLSIMVEAIDTIDLPIDERRGFCHALRQRIPEAPHGHALQLAELLGRQLDSLSPAEGAYGIARDGSGFVTATDVVHVDAPSPPGRLLRALAEMRLSAPGQTATRERLIEAGWPGEVIQPSAAKNRLRVAVATLRQKGLECIVTERGGYRLDEAVPIVWRSDGLGDHGFAFRSKAHPG